MRDGLLVHTGTSTTEIDIDSAAFIRADRDRETHRQTGGLTSS